MFIYIVTCQGFVKVGRTGNVSSRVRDLQAGCPFEVKLYRQFKVPKICSPARIENWCHFKLMNFWNGRGEWFKCSPRRALSIVESVILERETAPPKWSIRAHQTSTKGKILWARNKYRANMIRKMKARWKDPAYQNKMSNHLSEMSKALKKRWKDPDFRAMMENNMKKNWEDPECRSRMIKGLRHPKNRTRLKDAMKARWADPKLRACMSQGRKKKIK